MLEKSLVV